MTLSLTCNRCRTAITGVDEDELVVRVQSHVSEHRHGHGVGSGPSREHVLRRLRRQQEREARRQAKESGTAEE